MRKQQRTKMDRAKSGAQLPQLEGKGPRTAGRPTLQLLGKSGRSVPCSGLKNKASKRASNSATPALVALQSSRSVWYPAEPKTCMQQAGIIDRLQYLTRRETDRSRLATTTSRLARPSYRTTCRGQATCCCCAPGTTARVLCNIECARHRTDVWRTPRDGSYTNGRISKL